MLHDGPSEEELNFTFFKGCNSSWICLSMLLVIGLLAKGVPSSPPSWEGFDLKSIGFSSSSSSKYPTKRVRSQTLKVALTSYSHGNSRPYAFLLILWSTLRGSSQQELGFEFLYFGKLSLVKWSQTQSPSSKITSLLPLLFCLVISRFGVVFETSPSHAFSLNIWT